MPAKPFTVDHKIELLELLLEHAEDWEDGDDPDIRNFWHLVQREFQGAKGTTWQDKKFEDKMEKEEEAWLEEHEDSTMRRRRGHEKGSQYDVLMGKFHKFWNDSLKRHWQFMVDEGHELYGLLPDWVKDSIKPPVKPPKRSVAIVEPRSKASKIDGANAVTVRGKPLKQIVDEAIHRASSAGNVEVADNVRRVYAESLHNPKLMQLLQDVLILPPTPERNEEFSAYVRELKKRAKIPPPHINSGPPQQAGPGATFRAVPIIQPNWATRPGERPSNFACPTVTVPPARTAVQNSAPKNNQPAAKQTPSKATPATSPKSARTAKASRSKQPFKARGDFVHTSPPLDIVNPQRYRILGPLLYAPVVHQLLRKAPFRSDAELEILAKILTDDPRTTTDLVALAKRLEEELHQYDGGLSSRDKTNGQAQAGASRSEVNLSKRRRASQSSSDAAEEEDLLEAQRAAKRRKGAESDRDVEWDPSRRARKKARRAKRKALGRSDEEETMSETSDEDIELHKSAYVDEIVRKQKEEDARKVIEEQYGPVSPTDAGDGGDVDDWASMASPTLLPADLEDAEDEAPTCPTTRSRARTRVPVPPPPETGNASNEALQLISAAAAEAVARDPGIARLEAKLDSLLKCRWWSQAMPAPSSDGEGRMMERTATELAASCEETLSSIATMLRSSDLESQNPELNMAILRLTENATKSASYAARAAKRAAKMAQDVGVVLQLMASKTVGEQPATPLSSKEE